MMHRQSTELLGTLIACLLMTMFQAFSWAAAPQPQQTQADSKGFVQSVRNGPWSEPATWKPARVPQAGDTVLISPGTLVVYDIKSDELIREIHVAGVLSFARDRDTLLNVCLLKVQPRNGDSAGSGTGVEDPRDAEHNHDSHQGHSKSRKAGGAALLVGTQDEPIPAGVSARIRLHFIKGMDPNKVPAIVCRPGGRMEFRGASMKRTWLKLAKNVKPGDDRVSVSDSVAGWSVGDQVIVTGSSRDHSGKAGTEARRIKKINGSELLLDKVLAGEHFGQGRYRSEVANLSRNVVIESANPDGVRGHTMFHRYSRGGISYARFAHLGKKSALGRYPIHFHRVRDSMRGSSVIGAAIVGSHNRWVTIHGTQYMVVRDCVGYQSVGHGYFLEDGTEVYNILDRNLGVQALDGKHMKDQALPFDPNDGAAFWWANGRNTMVRNVAVENDHYGYRYDSQKRSNFDSNLAIRMSDGSNKVTDIRTIPIYRFQGNEAHTEGLYAMVFAGTDGVGPDTRHPHMIKDALIWQTHYALRAELPTMRIDNVHIDHAAYGIYRPWFENHEYRDIYISRTNAEPFNRGQDDRSIQHGSISVDGLTFDHYGYGGQMPLIQISANNLSGKAESHFRNVKVNRDSKHKNRWPLVNLGGGPRLQPKTQKGVPVYIHDWYGPGRHAKVVSTRSKEFKSDGLEYRKDPPLTGDESVVAEVKDIGFPKLLSPVDDQPPATVVTYPSPGSEARLIDGTLTIRGTTTDNVKTRRVVIMLNSPPAIAGAKKGKAKLLEAADIDFDFHRWELTLKNLKPGKIVIEAYGEDEAGNIEKTPHQTVFQVR
jgi:hypothetical protein